MKRVFTLLLVAGLFSSCGSSESSNSSSDSTKKDTKSKEGISAESSEPAKAESKWQYSEEVDKMTSAKNYFATIESDNQLDFEFPYDGGSNGTITVRKMAKSTDVLIGISKGQFNSHSDGTTVKVRFDDKKPINFTCSEPSDGSSDALFIDSPKKFLTLLKSAKKVIVQAEFYESGLKEMEFDTKDFKWNH
ncbi:hypothetical protein MUGA111182_03990 [Mucilaginibacter galii]|uniref:Lipoprotein n=1 Tax=Mucilaginibacter galii TaxID=2005073 RepID=A0A917JAF2_9SPHI|nr:hypothetical protein [Mucilaginibacter galii]GGI50957.1 hypothetical protein GCM10011425_21690 [Mucilaginibacter galii]